MPTKKIWLISLALLCLGLLPAGGAQAHKLLVAAVAEADGALKVQAFFPDGAPAREVPVTLSPGDGRAALAGRTDSQGVCRFASLPAGQYRVEVGDPLGHRAETRVVVGGGAPVQAAPTAKAAPAAPAAGAPPGEPFPWMNLLAGLGFIFGITAFLMALKLRGEVKKLASRD